MENNKGAAKAGSSSIAVLVLAIASFAVAVVGTGLSIANTVQLSSPAATGTGLVPIGTILPYGGTTPPSEDWVLCDGASLSMSKYSELFSVIGTAFGTPDGAGVAFNVPDLRGRFLRGVDDDDSALDEDRATRTAMHPNGNTGALVGSVQEEDLKAHMHSIDNMALFSVASGPVAGIWSSGAGTHPTTSSTGAETRPDNAYVNFIVRVK